jgi:hypothetical protein
MKNNRIFYSIPKLIVCLLFFQSCQDRVEKVITGWWTIDTIYYRNFDIKPCLSLNVITFGETESVFPYSQNSCAEVICNSNIDQGTWNVSKTSQNDTIPLRLKIDTKNQIFAGTHKVVFYKDDVNKLLKMEIYSDSLYVICRKGLFNYDKNIDLIENLEKLSWYNRSN